MLIYTLQFLLLLCPFRLYERRVPFCYWLLCTFQVPKQSKYPYKEANVEEGNTITKIHLLSVFFSYSFYFLTQVSRDILKIVWFPSFPAKMPNRFGRTAAMNVLHSGLSDHKASPFAHSSSSRPRPTLFELFLSNTYVQEKNASFLFIFLKKKTHRF